MIQKAWIPHIEQRLGLSLSQLEGLEGANALCQAMVTSIPFENLDVLSGISINDETCHLYQKLILSQRGGVCFELNNFLYELLMHCGYCVYRVAARMFVDGELRDVANHIALVVELNGEKFIADVGDARAMSQVIPMNGRRGFEELGITHKIKLISKDYYQLWLHDNEGASPRYQFNDELYHRRDFKAAIAFIEHDERSIFNKQWVVSKLQGDCRIALSDEHVARTSSGGKTITPYHPDERPTLLAELFGIVTR
ncbi:arylamine N-acetyltransferase [Photobacterium sp. BZF1]|uniref:arylamine N-acetyltransferase family protein n=1 Tax=Photobacterium sp. BZF1 TaxID=1904457 RepID=UPI001653B5BF|nr:arylamine N-acetyltransferase [Photobacterium sp. BZF1]MBC7003026.1 arylamine N-acetyltransferase [Photobacterium sp. BZF1]